MPQPVYCQKLYWKGFLIAEKNSQPSASLDTERSQI